MFMLMDEHGKNGRTGRSLSGIFGYKPAVTDNGYLKVVGQNAH
jgi:hypothetical protein